jgi:hypothetical protein
LAAGFSGKPYLGLPVSLFCGLNFVFDCRAFWVRPKLARKFSR